MATILVVDDSAVDRHLVGGLLERDTALRVDYATDGADALRKMGAAAPDLVVTDLMMPELDGLQLVSAVRSRFPYVPVILTTSQGNEEIAVQALHQGAASYVPKHALARRLLDTVHRVLAISGRERSYLRLWNCITAAEYALELENDSSLIGPLVAYFQEHVSRMGLCDETDRMRIGVALEEALTNAMYHGNLQIGSELREEDDRAYCVLVEARRNQTPYKERRIHVCARLSRDEAVFVVRDEGCGFDPSGLPDPTDPANLERVSGRGILLMRTFMDDVVYRGGGNEVVLTKRRAANLPLVPDGR